MERNYIYVSDVGSACHNLALDSWLLENRVGDDDLILYFYINENAVIIGKNQNPLKECDLKKMRQDGVELVRRISGGGAVYHDNGNLNFSFIAGKNRFDKDRQHKFILACIQSLGIECSFSGRNDLLAGGRKFSGNAYASRGHAKGHHGTLLVDSKLDKLTSYLTADERKLRSKGVDSVRSRVCNLKELKPDLTTLGLLKVICDGFAKEYGKYEPLTFSDSELLEIKKQEDFFASDEWKLSKTPAFDFIFDERFDFGGVQMMLSLRNNKITDIKVFTDSMDTSLPKKLEEKLMSLDFKANNILSAISPEDEVCITYILKKLAEML